MARSLMLCADDYGLSAGIDEVIAGLVRAGRLSAFSCLTQGPAWRQDAAQAAALRSQARVGLHFNLTEGQPLSPALRRHWPQLPGVGRLLLLAHLGGLPRAAIQDELLAQVSAFEDASGCAPDFIDGHQHVHHLPGVRQWVLQWAIERGLPVRSTAQLAGPASAFKCRVIEHSGGKALARALAAQGLPHNRLLLGAYDFDQADYRGLMQAWLAQVPEGGALLFCHPGPAASLAAGDVIAVAREREAAYLASDAFMADVQAAGVTLAPIWPAGPSPGK